MLALVLALAAGALAADDVHALRAARRAAVRAAVAAKAGEPAPFGLLVIPVDFADVRFPDGYDPGTGLRSRLDAPEAGSMAHYFDAASRGRSSLAIAVSPVVSLPGLALDYSDLDWQGNTRTRAMVTAALEGAIARGLDFADSDQDHDGEVDGVLVVHAAPGLLEDPDALFPPQQYFLDEPVLQRGIVARSYAIVAVGSPLGIWAHETGHLFGLEERYDVNLPGTSETGPRGGLGAFSLMSAGWLGTGAGEDPSLPDGYSALQMGWADSGTLPRPGTVVRLDPSDPGSLDYWLAEIRDPAATAPYDAALPAERLILYHIDRSLAETEASSFTWPDRHLRVTLVEADGANDVARGWSNGDAEDLFPSGGVAQVYDDGTVPAARTWGGDPSGIDVAVSVTGGELMFENRAMSVRADLRISFVGNPVVATIEARVTGVGDLPNTVSALVTVEDPRWGTFASGASIAIDLTPFEGDDDWATHRATTAPWQPAGEPPSGALTTFHIELTGGAIGSGDLVWVWDTTAAPFALDGAWPGDWTAEIATGETRWHRWTDTAALGAGAARVLACTGNDDVSATAWPDVTYGNDAHAQLLSPALGADVRWVELTHAVDLELLYPGRAIDGVNLTWVHDGGTTTPAVPLDGWQGDVDGRAEHVLAGMPTFAVADPLESDGAPLWRREILPLPDRATHGPGPWRLRLELASDSLWRARGWLVRDLIGHADEEPASAFPVAAEAGRLTWKWTGPGEAIDFRIERSDDGGAGWIAIENPTLNMSPDGTFDVPIADLEIPAGFRSLVRVVAITGSGAAVASRAMPLEGADAPVLGWPHPNPAPGVVSVDVDGAGDTRTALAVYDLRGRLIRRWRPGPSRAVIVWDGRAGDGRRVAAGVYIFRLRAHDSTLTRKVTWLP